MAEQTTNAYAVVDKDGLVINAIVWNGIKPLTPPEGCTFVPIYNSEAGIGYSYIDGKFIPPEEEPTPWW